MEEQLITERSNLLVVEDGNDGGRESHCGDHAPSGAIAVVIFSTCVVVLGSFSYGYAAAFTSSAESGIMKDLGLSIAEYSLFGSIGSIGSMIAAALSGNVADQIGRRGTMLLVQVFSILGWLGVVFAKGTWLLDAGKVSTGIAVALQCYVAPVYIGEIAPKNIRGACTVANQFVATFGMSLMYFIGNLITWRILALLGIVPCVLQIVGLFFIPESPRWLLSVGQEKRFETTLQQLRGKYANVSQEAAEIRDSLETSRQLSKSKFIDLFKKKYAPALMLGVGSTVLVQFGGAYAIGSYASSIFEAAGSSASVGTMALAIIQLIFASLGVLLTDKCGRRPLWLISAAGTCLGNILAGLAFLLQDLHKSKEVTGALVLIGILVFSSTFSAGMSSSQWLIMSEILPPNIKGLAGSLIILLNWFLSWIVIYAFNFMLAWSKAGTFFIYASFCAATFLFVAKLLPETKGQSLEEIEALISNRRW